MGQHSRSVTVIFSRRRSRCALTGCDVFHRGVVAAAGIDPIFAPRVDESGGEADLNRAEGAVAALVGALVAEGVTLFEPRDNRGHSGVKRSDPPGVDDFSAGLTGDLLHGAGAGDRERQVEYWRIPSFYRYYR